MQMSELSFLADALLALCERDRTAPFYTDDAFRDKMRRADRREAAHAHLVMGIVSQPLFLHECADVIRQAGLTERQHDVIRQRLAGRTFEEIGRRGGHSKQGAQNIYLQGLKKLMRSFDTYPYRGLGEVYRDETRRGLGAGRGVTLRVGRI